LTVADPLGQPKPLAKALVATLLLMTLSEAVVAALDVQHQHPDVSEGREVLPVAVGVGATVGQSKRPVEGLAQLASGEIRLW